MSSMFKNPIVAPIVVQANLVNDVITIVNGTVTLSYNPLSNKIINNIYMITETLNDSNYPDSILIHTEEIMEFTINNKVIDLQTNFYDGLDFRVSYITEDKI